MHIFWKYPGRDLNVYLAFWLETILSMLEIQIHQQQIFVTAMFTCQLRLDCLYRHCHTQPEMCIQEKHRSYSCMGKLCYNTNKGKHHLISAFKYLPSGI